MTKEHCPMSGVNVECLVGGGHPPSFIPNGTTRLFRKFLEEVGLSSGEFKLNVTAPAQGNPQLQAARIRATGVSDNAVCVTFQSGNNGNARSGFLMPLGDLTAQQVYDAIVAAANEPAAAKAAPRVKPAAPPPAPPAPAPAPTHVATPGSQLLRLLKAVEGIVFSRGDLKTIVPNEKRDQFIADYAMALPDGSFALSAEAIVLALKEATHHDGAGTEATLKIGSNIGRAAQTTDTLLNLKAEAETTAAESAAAVTELAGKERAIQEEIDRLKETLEELAAQKATATTTRDADAAKVRGIESTLSAYDETLQDERVQTAAKAAQAMLELRQFLA